MGAGRGQLDYGRVIAGEHVTHADARVPFASSRNSESIPPSFIACITRDAGLLLTGLSSHIYSYSRHRDAEGEARPWHARHLSMVKKYIRKGGWGGARSGSGLPPGFWQDQGGKKAAAAANKQRQAEAEKSAEAARCTQKQRWQQWAAGRGTAPE